MEIPAFLTTWPLQSLLAIVAGVVILLVPRVLGYVVALYLLAVGVLGLLVFFQGQGVRPQAAISLVAGVVILIKPTVLSYVVGTYLILIGVLEAGLVRI